MSEVTEGELVVWSVDPGPMAGALELKLWRIATAARSYLNRMRAAELAHGVAAGERDAVTVERDEAKEACDLLEMERDDACGKLDDLRADLHNVRAHSVAAEEARDLAVVERDEAYKQRDAAVHLGNVLASERDMARLAEAEAQLGGRAASREIAELQVELAEARRERDEALAKVADLESMRAGVAYFACWPDGMLEALGATDVSGVADVMDRVMALVGAERERDRLLRSEADACAILGAAPDELLSDAAQRVRNEAGRYRSWVNECALSIGESKHSNVPDRVAAMARAEVPSGGQIRALQQEAEGARAAMRRMEIDHAAALAVARMDAAEAEPPQADLREILRARDGESLGDAARRLAASRDEMMEEASRARTELGARADESAEGAALRVMRDLVKARSAQDEVFRIQHEIAIAGDLVTIRVAPLRDPAIRALPLGVQLGLVVCDE